MVRHLVTIDDLSETEIQAIFALADEFLAEKATPGKPYRIQGNLRLADEFILATTPAVVISARLALKQFLGGGKQFIKNIQNTGRKISE